MSQKFTLNMNFLTIEEFLRDCDSNNEEFITETFLKFKNNIADQLANQIISQRIKPVRQARFEFFWSEKQRNRNKAPIPGFAREIVIDALIRANVLRNGGWDSIVNWTDHFHITGKKSIGWMTEDAQPGVMIIMHDVLEEFKHLITSKDPAKDKWDHIEELKTTHNDSIPD